MKALKSFHFRNEVGQHYPTPQNDSSSVFVLMSENIQNFILLTGQCRFQITFR